MKTILVARKADEFSRILAASDFKIINLPLIETSFSEDLNDFESKLATIENYDGIFLTSSKAAEIFRAKLREKKLNFRGAVYVLGRSSFEVLSGENLKLIYNENANTAQEMLRQIAPDDLKHKKFFFIRGEKSMRVVPIFLKKIATVEESIVYRTEKIAVENDKAAELSKKFKNREIAAACFFSPSQAESFIEQFGAEIAHQTIIATIGKTTAEYFERLNVKVGLISSKSNVETFAKELAEYLRNG